MTEATLTRTPSDRRTAFAEGEMAVGENPARLVKATKFDDMMAHADKG
jgi:hypothetical protein